MKSRKVNHCQEKLRVYFQRQNENGKNIPKIDSFHLTSFFAEKFHEIFFSNYIIFSFILAPSGGDCTSWASGGNPIEICIT